MTLSQESRISETVKQSWFLTSDSDSEQQGSHWNEQQGSHWNDFLVVVISTIDDCLWLRLDNINMPKIPETIQQCEENDIPQYVPWYPTIYHEIPRDTTIYHDIPRYSTRFHEITWDPWNYPTTRRERYPMILKIHNNLPLWIHGCATRDIDEEKVHSISTTRGLEFDMM